MGPILNDSAQQPCINAKDIFNQSGQHEDLDKAINTFCEALHELVSGHPTICLVSTNLGRALIIGYSLTHKIEYLEKSMAAFRVAVTCETAPVSVRFHAAKLWASHADESTHESALAPYQAAIELLPCLATLGLDLQSRQQALTSGTYCLARDAAACTIQSGQYGTVVELLKAGHGVFWSQALQLCMPLANLRDVAPKLKEKLRYISVALEQGLLRDVAKNLSDTPQKVMSMEKEASHSSPEQ